MGDVRVEGELQRITLVTSTGVTFVTEVEVATETPGAGGRYLQSLALLGVYIGVIPVFLGIFWFPALRQLGRRTMTFLMAATARLLIFLGLDTVAEALEVAAQVPSAFQGIGLIGIGAVATFMLLDAMIRPCLVNKVTSEAPESISKLSISMVAIASEE